MKKIFITTLAIMVLSIISCTNGGQKELAAQNDSTIVVTIPVDTFILDSITSDSIEVQ